ncbi:MAG TPA: hypothetical protein VFO07_08565, partial [Roseiflexaceae bacterium]|nr:hypothetical protein [Roseiflexaceae bacterium]
MKTETPRLYAYVPPRLHPSLVLSSFQLLAWILFRPSAWRDYIVRLDPSLQPDCTLLDIGSSRNRYSTTHPILVEVNITYLPTVPRLEPGRVYSRHPLMWRILFSYLVYLPLVLSVSALVLWLFGRTGEIFIVGLIAPIVVAILYFVLAGIWINLAVGLVLSVLGSMIFALGYSIRGGLGYPIAANMIGALSYNLVIGLAGGLAGTVATNISKPSLDYSLSRWNLRVSGTLTGILLSGVAMFTMLSILRYTSYALGGVFLPSDNPQSLPLAVALVLILVLSFVAVVLWRHTSQLLLINGLMVIALLAMFAIMRNLNFFQAPSITLPTLFIAMIGLPYGIVVRIAGPRVAAAAATLGLSAWWYVATVTTEPPPSWLLFLPTVA